MRPLKILRFVECYADSIKNICVFALTRVPYDVLSVIIMSWRLIVDADFTKGERKMSAVLGELSVYQPTVMEVRRRQFNLSQAQLGQLVRRDQMIISSIENGRKKPAPDLRDAIAQALLLSAPDKLLETWRYDTEYGPGPNGSN